MTVINTINCINYCINVKLGKNTTNARMTDMFALYFAPEQNTEQVAGLSKWWE